MCDLSSITVAGANPGPLKYTPATNAELARYSRSRRISLIPATPDGKTTAALVTTNALRQIRFFHLVSVIVL